MKSSALAIALVLCAGAALGAESRQPNVYVALVNATLARQSFPTPHPAGTVDAEVEIGADGYVVSSRLRGSDARLVTLTRDRLARVSLPPPPRGQYHLRYRFVFVREGQAK
jgi:hypothetical protein